MTSIKYSPTIQGRTFGDAGSIFDSAVQSLNRATSQASGAFDTFRQGGIDARNKRTQNALSVVQGAQTQEDYQALTSRLNSPEALTEAFGDININSVLAALRKQEQNVRNKETSDFNYNQTIAQRNDLPKLQQLNSELSGKSIEELEGLSRNPDYIGNLGLSNPNAGSEALQRVLGQKRNENLLKLNTTKTQLGINAAQSAYDASLTNTAQNAQVRQLYDQLSSEGPVTRSAFFNAGNSLNIPATKLRDFLDTTDEAVGKKIDKEGRQEVDDFLNKFDKTDDLGFLSAFGVDTSFAEANAYVAELQDAGVSNEKILKLLRQSLTGTDDFSPSIIDKYLDQIDPAKKEDELNRALNRALGGRRGRNNTGNR